ncbi:hypothetical protein [Sulfuriferula nivalis]|uniref:hypothetical protein n=1 Tax=Sulfuriferula nivalis TaxID=2675298 RepID=UPI00138A4179|nr:hypothetical protein [Sulfuriferula nivalis]
MNELLFFPIFFLISYGLYLTVVACIPFDFVTIFSRSSFETKPLNSVKARVSTFLSGIFAIVCAVFLGLLLYGATGG